MSCCKITLFRLTNLRISVSKFHELVPVVENKDPQQHYGPNGFFNDDFGKLTGTEPLFRGVRVAVIDPFLSHVTILLINLLSM